ncbi:hypothetical protein HPP92_011181 [Vanilla planifolia]|uniref:Alpha/beta hydrolase fold-3 domain-containing protein n=1 Tax=Vanilla planifolia TaxID=51239 RepID=A0A835V0H7_VANPL|nr:hypothetical protein HPP92_011181 [Vanilla planifolia]
MRLAMSSNDTDTAASVAEDDIIFDLISMIIVYRSGRVERFEPTEFVPPSFDSATGVDSKDVVINSSTSLSVRLYLPASAVAKTDYKLPVLVFFHGGGFCLHRASSLHYHNYLNHLTAKAKFISISVDYRLAPEHPLPVAYYDSWEAFRWVISGRDDWLLRYGDLGKVFIAGDSAGANIVHDLGLRLGRLGKKVEGLVMMNPYFWGNEKIGVELKERSESMFKVSDVEKVWPFICPGTTGNDDPRLNPMAEGAPSLLGLGCHRVLVGVGDKDLLLDRGRLYSEKLKESGWAGEVEFVKVEGDHGFFLAYPGNETAEAFMDRVVSFCNKD